MKTTSSSASFPAPTGSSFISTFNSMCAEAVTFEESDLRVLIPDKVVRSGLQQNWNAVSRSLDKLAPEEMFDALERAALTVFSARPDEVTQENNADSRWLRQQQEQGALEGLKAAGIKDPLAAINARDAEEARRVAAYKEQQNAGIDEFMPDQETPQAEEIHILRLPDQFPAGGVLNVPKIPQAAFRRCTSHPAGLPGFPASTPTAPSPSD